MKTIEEKARAYDEVLTKAAALYKASEPMSGCNVIIETLFPELKESDDEKIRKSLIHLVHLYGGEFGMIDANTSVEKAIAWLEKQAEQKPQRMISAEAKEAMYDKPADTVEPKFKVGDKIYLKPEYRMPNDDTPIANTVKEIRRIDDKHYRFDGSYIFIEDQDKYELVEQKPKENKGNIGGISANWSEEDKKIINGLIDSLTRISLNTRTDSTSPNYTFYKEIAWLKSLRPQNKWKPSDEQMEALYKASKNEYLKADQYDVLLELWNNLKKLKEE